MPEEWDDILRDIEANKQIDRQEQAAAQKELTNADDQTVNRLAEERRKKIEGFQLQLDLDETGVHPPAVPAPTTETPSPSTAESTLTDPPVTTPDTLEREIADATQATPVQRQSKRRAKDRTTWGCIRGVIYGCIVLAVSITLAYFGVAGGLDLTGLNKSDEKITITLTEEQCVDTKVLADVLKEAGIIDQPLIFRLYCSLTKADGQFQPQEEVTLSADMGYETIINRLKTVVRETIRLTFPEGSTILEMAAKLEDNNVCTAEEFINAIETGEYSYDFLSEIPTGSGYEGRTFRLEGYLFPDTYDFYLESSGEAAVRKFLDAFDDRVDPTMRAKIKANGQTLNDIVIKASLVQWEAAKIDDMYGVARVIQNRLDNPSTYPRLECDSAQRYIKAINAKYNYERAKAADYDTYTCSGLPVGPINNPGLDAIEAAISPSEDSSITPCYYFATDLETGITYYSKTLAEHEAICRRYGIGMYA